MLANLLTDTRYAVRGLRAAPAFTLMAVTTLALGIGAITAVGTVFYGVLLRPLPYADQDRIVMVWEDLGNGAQSLPAVHALDYLDYREWNQTFEDFVIATGAEAILTGEGEAELVDGGLVATHFFEFFGIEPEAGRTFRPEESVPGGSPVTMLSDRLWRRRFGADPDIIGQTVEINGVAHEIIGRLPADFRLLLPAEAFRLRDSDLWRPLRIDPDRQPPRNYTGSTVFGKIDAGVTMAAAQADMSRIATRLREQYPVHATANTRLRVVPLHRDVVKGVAPALRVLLAAVGLVLLVACGNVANLLLARGSERRREIAVRAAVGASRGRIAFGVLLESALLTAMGGVLGVGFAVAALRGLPALASGALPRQEAIGVDATVLLLVAGACAVTTVLFGLLPALHGSRADPAVTLRDSSVIGGGQSRMRALLVGSEVALSVMLLVGAGLLIRSFIALQGADPGFEPDRALTFRVRVPAREYQGAARVALFDQLRADLESIPQVQQVTAITQLPLTGTGPLQPFAYDEETARNWESVTADQRGVWPGFFAAMGATRVDGRAFSTADDVNAPRAIMIDESLAEMAFPGRVAVGERLQIGPEGDPESFAEVIGVVRHLRLYDVGADHLPQIYFPYGQYMASQLSFVVRSDGDLSTLVDGVRAAVRRIDPAIPVTDVRTLGDLVAASTEQARFNVLLMTGFGAMALVLVAVGLYGVIASSVGRRTREIGIRIALGQSPAETRRLVIGQGLRLVFAGVTIGLIGAVALANLLAGILYGVNAFDLPTYAGVAVVLLTIGTLSCWRPAYAATRIAPTDALRAE